MNKSQKYLAIEGGEHAGKTKMINTLFLLLSAKYKFNVVKVREPHFYRKEIKKLLNDLIPQISTDNDLLFIEQHMYMMTAILNLFMADRTTLLKHIIKPALEKNPDTFILSDRCVLSSWIYQYEYMKYIVNSKQSSLKEPHGLIVMRHILDYFCSNEMLPDKIIVLHGNTNRHESSEFMDNDDDFNNIINYLYNPVNIHTRLSDPNRLIHIDVTEYKLEDYVEHCDSLLKSISGPQFS
jgi:thymidylate kinase